MTLFSALLLFVSQWVAQPAAFFRCVHSHHHSAKKQSKIRNLCKVTTCLSVKDLTKLHWPPFVCQVGWRSVLDRAQNWRGICHSAESRRWKSESRSLQPAAEPQLCSSATKVEYCALDTCWSGCGPSFPPTTRPSSLYFSSKYLSKGE